MTAAPEANRFVLLCKSFRQDVRRVERMMVSAQRFNTDDIPVVLCVPERDVALFRQHLTPFRYTLITDEAVVQAHPHAEAQALLDRYRRTAGSLSQQVVKSEAWRLLGCDAYLCLDSDTVFLRPFCREDFLAADGHPYTVVHQDKDFFQLALCQGHSEVWTSFVTTSRRMQQRFGRPGPLYSYGPFPVLWSAQVWRDLDRLELGPKGLTLWDAIDQIPSEAHWYGEALLTFGSIPVHPIGPMCRCYHYNWQSQIFSKLGENESTLAEHFLCAVYQSNWDEALDHEPRRSRVSKWARTIKRLWR